MRTPVEGVAPERMRAAVREAYRPPPDRRFVMALGDVLRIFSPEAPAAQLTKEPTGWAVLQQGERVALLPDEASFEQLWQALLARARAVVPPGRAAGGRATQCEPFLAPGAWGALERAQTAWLRERDLRDLGTAARCLVALSVQLLDVMEIGDALPGRALAALAAYHSASGEDVADDLAALMQAMGYAAERGARDSAAARYLARLGAPATAGESSDTLSMLRLRFSVDDGRSPIAASRDLPYAVLRAVWEHGGASAEIGAPSAAPRPGMIWNLARTVPRLLRVSEEELLPAFERLLSRATRARPGPFADGEIVAAWYRGYFYSALFTMARHHLEQLSPSRPADEFGARLGAGSEGFAREFRTWYTGMADARTSRHPPEVLTLPFLHSLDVGPAALALYHEIRERMLHLQVADLLLMNRALFRHLDYRPSHRLALARLAYSAPMYDGFLARRLVEGALREAAGASARTATRSGDVLQRLVQSPGTGAEDLATMLEWLAEREPRPVDLLAAGYRRLALLRPAELRPAVALAGVLDDAGRRAEAREVLRQWVERNATASAYDRAMAGLRIAELHFEDGQARQALSAVAPALRWQTDRALRLAALARELLGESREATEAARALKSRHPSSYLAPLTQAELDWRRGRPREAAEALAGARHAVETHAAVAAMAERFLRVFDASRPVADSHAAFDALRAHFHPFVLREIVIAAQRAGRDRLAFDLASRLESDGLGGVELAFLAYQSLRRMDAETSLAWLRSRIPADAAPRLAQIAHRRGAPEAMWLHVTEAGDRATPHVWLLRAAESRLAAGAEAERRRLREVFAASAADFEATLTRHLLGLADEAEVFRLARSAQQIYTMAYFLGAKAEAEGRLVDALAWYRITLEAGVLTSAPDRDGSKAVYRSMDWWREALRTGVLFAPTELRWALERMPVLRDRVLASGVELDDRAVGAPQPVRHGATEVRRQR